MLIDCSVKPGHYDFLFKTSFKTHCLFWILFFENIVLTEYYSLDGHFHGEFPQKKSSSLLSESVPGCSVCAGGCQSPRCDPAELDHTIEPAACQCSCWALALYVVSSSATLGPGGCYSWLPSVLLSLIPVLIENKSFQ